MSLITDKSAKAVSLREWNNWLKENSKLTWHVDGYGPDGVRAIKYMSPQFDTRTMKIYHISTSGIGNYCVDFREEFPGTILDLLAHKIKNKITMPPDMDAWEYVRQIQIEKFNRDFPKDENELQDSSVHN
jgi:hypothetical protein